MYENDLDKFSGQRLTLEAQVRTWTSASAVDYTDAVYLYQINAIESANMNLEHLNVMKEGASVLKGIHGKLCVRVTIMSMFSYNGRNRTVTSTRLTQLWNQFRNRCSLRTRYPKPSRILQRAWVLMCVLSLGRSYQLLIGLTDRWMRMS